LDQPQGDVVVRANCNAQAFQNELDDYQFRPEHKILANSFNYDLNTKITDIICTCKNAAKLKKILPTTTTAQPVIIYPQCPRILFTAFMRQLRQSPNTATPYMIRKYQAFCDHRFQTIIQPLLRDFEYDVDDWMNHVTTRNKQLEVLPYYEQWLLGIKDGQDWSNNDYTLFAKSEKQTKINGKWPKCRAISACPPNVKWIMGPVIYALEKLFATLPGYKIVKYDSDMNVVGTCKTWEEVEDKYEILAHKGYDISIDIDGSAWDSTQLNHMKYPIFLIYEYLAKHSMIHHVDTDLFLNIATAKKRKLTAKSYINGREYIIFSALIDATMFSGSMDTTFSNTETNNTVGEFVKHCAGLGELDLIQNCAGDDYNGFINSQVYKNHEVEFHIKQCWTQLGLVPKHIIVGDYSNINFCSTAVIPYKDAKTKSNKFKIIRQIDRLNPLSHYSIKALHYSAAQMKTHYRDLKKGLQYWGTGVPLIQEYIDAFQHYEDKIPGEYGKIPDPQLGKMHFGTKPPVEQQKATYEEQMETFRVSVKLPPREAVMDFLLTKYQLTQDSLVKIKEGLYKQICYDELLNNN